MILAGGSPARRRLPALACAAVAAVLLTGCSGSKDADDEGDAPAATTTTTTAPPSPTTTTNQQFCAGLNAFTFALYDDLWVRCSEFYPDGDVQAWRVEFCHDDNVDIPWPTGDIHYTLDELYRFIWFWSSVCQQYGPGAGVRDTWLNDVCFNGTMSYIFSDYGLWIECKQRRPSLDDWNHYYFHHDHAAAGDDVSAADHDADTALERSHVDRPLQLASGGCPPPPPRRSRPSPSPSPPTPRSRGWTGARCSSAWAAAAQLLPATSTSMSAPSLAAALTVLRVAALRPALSCSAMTRMGIVCLRIRQVLTAPWLRS